MAGRLDLLKSLVRSATHASAERLRDLKPVANARKVLEELKARRATLDEQMVSKALARAEGVRGVSVRLSDGRIGCDLSYDDGANLVFAVIPDQARFAPRGAKEVVFRVEPPEQVGDARVREAVGTIAAAIARALWGPVLGPRENDETALVEREGARLRADLRSVPAVRSVLEGSPLAMALDVIGIERFEIAERTLRFHISLPMPPVGG